MSNVIDPVKLSDTLRSEPFVLVHLLSEMPPSLDLADWRQLSWPGYEPVQSICTVIDDQSPDAIGFMVRSFFPVPTIQASIPFFGISLYGRGIVVGQVLDSDNQPITNWIGTLDLTLTFLLQSYIPPV